MTRVLAGWLVLFILAVPAAAAAEEPGAELAPTGKHCLGEPGSKIMLKQALAVSINPLGPEHYLTLARCMPLIKAPGLLFMLTNVEAGLFSVLNVPYSHLGAYASVTPLSVLVLRAELQGVSIWPADAFNGAGYFPRESYDESWRGDAVAGGTGGVASGFAAKFSAKLQVEIPIGPVSLAVTNKSELEHWTVGHAPIYFNMRRDLILPRSAWLFMNSAVVAVGYDFTPNIKGRVGLMDYILYSPASEYLAHRISALVTVSFARLGSRVRNLQPFLAFGGYTHHGVRQGELNLIVGVATTYDLSEMPEVDEVE